MTRAALEKKFVILRELEIRTARKSLWDYCKLESPEFYRENRWHLKLNCWVLQALYEGRLTKAAFMDACREIAPAWYYEGFDFTRLIDDWVYTKLMQNLPPRIGKSRTLVNFCKWVLGREITNKIITASYNDEMAQDFSRYTRDGIQEAKTYPHEICYNDIFPNAKVKEGNASYKQWALEGNFFNYKGAGVGGGVTGRGCNVSIVDDPVKDAEDAFNELALAKIWRWYSGTFKSRLEKGGIQIVNHTRWAKGDICGRILENEAEAQEWFIFVMEARDEETGEMLCPDLLDEAMYEDLKRNVDEAIFAANYHQTPVDLKGRLYKDFLTYTEPPKDEHGNLLFERIINYTDTADTGNDYLASICAGVYNGQLYVLDVLYTKEGMEITEPNTADLLVKNNVQNAVIESNNGGRGFARNVERLIWERHKTRNVGIVWLHQTKNKIARILSKSTFVMQNVYFPVNWKDRWPEYYKAMNEYQKEGKNKNDDAPDATTGLCEVLDAPQPRARSL
jgi:predicted phage terminase large subunit-like protein